MWTPDPGTPLFGGSEAAAVDIVITYVPDDPGTGTGTGTGTDGTGTGGSGTPLPPPTGYSGVWLSSSIPSAVVITGDASGLLLNGPNAIGMGNIGIDYMTDKVSHHIIQWDDLPDSAQEIYHYAAPAVNIVTAQLQVSAHFAAGPDVVAVFTFQATIDYSSGRDRLILEINKRR